jgi:chemotaxis protein MotB
MSGVGSTTGNRASLVNEMKGELDKWLPDRLRSTVEITHAGGLVTISMKADSMTFPVGEARLTEEVRQILDTIGPSLRESLAPLLVEGHTCDLPINTAQFPSNWELSAQRATNVMVYLIRHWGINPDHVSAVGYADTRPLAPNDSASNRIRNRRVDIVVLSEGYEANGAARAGDATGERTNDSLRLRPVRIRPTIDLRARYYQHTGRRTPDTPASDL